MRHSLLLAAAALLFAASVALAQQNKVDICHIPPGNPSAAQMITVSESRAPDHLAHGDLGPNNVFPCACPCEGPVRECVSGCTHGEPECLAACRGAFRRCLAAECGEQ